MDDLGSYYAALQNQVNLNNSWSAEQAQKQMDFQERMSNTAHQREVADLKAAGLNPILSARLGGASTPSGASATADTSMVGAMVELMSKMMDVQETSAAASYAAAASADGQADAADNPSFAEGLSQFATSGKGALNAFTGFFHGFTGKSKAKYDNDYTYAKGAQMSQSRQKTYEGLSNVKVYDRKTGTSRPMTEKEKKKDSWIYSLQKALTGSNRKLL